jgi:hypothetical protein
MWYIVYDMRIMFIYSYYYMSASRYFLFVCLQFLLYDFIYAACRLQPILIQAIKRLGYAWDFVEAMGQRTTAGIQYCVRFRQNQAIDSSLVGYIYGIPCLRRYEAMESVLVRVLHYIDNDRGYTIRDIRYW